MSGSLSDLCDVCDLFGACVVCVCVLFGGFILRGVCDWRCVKFTTPKIWLSQALCFSFPFPLCLSLLVSFPHRFRSHVLAVFLYLVLSLSNSLLSLPLSTPVIW